MIYMSLIGKAHPSSDVITNQLYEVFNPMSTIFFLFRLIMLYSSMIYGIGGYYFPVR